MSHLPACNGIFDRCECDALEQREYRIEQVNAAHNEAHRLQAVALTYRTEYDALHAAVTKLMRALNEANGGTPLSYFTEHLDAMDAVLARKKELE